MEDLCVCIYTHFQSSSTVSYIISLSLSLLSHRHLLKGPLKILNKGKLGMYVPNNALAFRRLLKILQSLVVVHTKTSGAGRGGGMIGES